MRLSNKSNFFIGRTTYQIRFVSFTMREVISVHVGQAGVQIGNNCWELYWKDSESSIVIIAVTKDFS